MGKPMWPPYAPSPTELSEPHGMPRHTAAPLTTHAAALLDPWCRPSQAMAPPLQSSPNPSHHQSSSITIINHHHQSSSIIAQPNPSSPNPSTGWSACCCCSRTPHTPRPRQLPPRQPPRRPGPLTPWLRRTARAPEPRVRPLKLRSLALMAVKHISQCSLGCLDAASARHTGPGAACEGPVAPGSQYGASSWMPERQGPAPVLASSLFSCCERVLSAVGKQQGCCVLTTRRPAGAAPRAAQTGSLLPAAVLKRVGGGNRPWLLAVAASPQRIPLLPAVYPSCSLVPPCPHRVSQPPLAAVRAARQARLQSALEEQLAFVVSLDRTMVCIVFNSTTRVVAFASEAIAPRRQCLLAGHSAPCSTQPAQRTSHHAREPGTARAVPMPRANTCAVPCRAHTHADSVCQRQERPPSAGGLAVRRDLSL
jgi:hypothetical protein